MDIDLDKAHKFAWVMVLIGVLLMVVGAPIFRNVLTTTQLASESGKAINENSAAGIKSAYAIDFSLGAGETITATFSNNAANVSVTLKIVTRATFDLRFAQNGTASGLTGLNFLYTHPTTGVTPTGTNTNALTESYGDFYIVEFGGDYSGTRIVTEPGDYTLIVYGTNSTNLVANENVMFNINVVKSFPGRMVAFYLNWIGFGVTIGFLALAILLIAKKTVEGRV